MRTVQEATDGVGDASAEAVGTRSAAVSATAVVTEEEEEETANVVIRREGKGYCV